MEDSNNLNTGNPMSQSLASMKSLIAKMSGDMYFVAIVTIIYGALNCLSIIGALFGIPLIFAGIRLKESSEELKAYIHSDQPAALQNAIERMSRYFNINKILFIVMIAFFILYILGIILFFAIAGGELYEQFNSNIA